MSSHATTRKLKGFSITVPELQHAYDITCTTLAAKYDLRRMNSRNICDYIGLEQDPSMIYHVVNGTGSSIHVLTELLKMIYHVDRSLLPGHVIQELEDQGHSIGLEEAYPHRSFIRNINKKEVEE